MFLMILISGVSILRVDIREFRTSNVPWEGEGKERRHGGNWKKGMQNLAQKVGSKLLWHISSLSRLFPLKGRERKVMEREGKRQPMERGGGKERGTRERKEGGLGRNRRECYTLEWSPIRIGHYGKLSCGRIYYMKRDARYEGSEMGKKKLLHTALGRPFILFSLLFLIN